MRKYKRRRGSGIRRRKVGRRGRGYRMKRVAAPKRPRKVPLPFSASLLKRIKTTRGRGLRGGARAPGYHGRSYGSAVKAAPAAVKAAIAQVAAAPKAAAKKGWSTGKKALAGLAGLAALGAAAAHGRNWKSHGSSFPVFDLPSLPSISMGYLG